MGYLLANSALRAFPAALASHAITEREDSAPDFAWTAVPMCGDGDGMSGEECEEKNMWRREEGRLKSWQAYYVISLT